MAGQSGSEWRSEYYGPNGAIAHMRRQYGNTLLGLASTLYSAAGASFVEARKVEDFRSRMAFALRGVGEMIEALWWVLRFRLARSLLLASADQLDIMSSILKKIPPFRFLARHYIRLALARPARPHTEALLRCNLLALCGIQRPDTGSEIRRIRALLKNAIDSGEREQAIRILRHLANFEHARGSHAAEHTDDQAIGALILATGAKDQESKWRDEQNERRHY